MLDKLRTVIFFLPIAGCALLFAQTTAQSQKDLTQRHADYLRLNRQIFVRTDDLEAQRNHVSSRDQFPPIEAGLRAILDEAIAAVAASSSSADDVKKEINTIQGELTFGRADMSNAPFAEFAQLNASRTLVVDFVIMEGGDAIPDSQPFIEFYTRENAKWNLKATVGSDFNASTLFISRINAGLAGENWYLAWGTRIGDTGTRLKIRLYAFDGNKVRTVWKRDGLVRGLIEVSPNSISLDYASRYAPTERVNNIHEVLYVTPNGLE